MLQRTWPLVLALLLMACSPVEPPPSPTLTIAPASLTIPGGAPAATFTATATGSSAAITWSLQGPGSLANDTGPTAGYTPPATVATAQTATLTATLTGTGVTAQAAITITPVTATKGTLRITVTGLGAGEEADATVTGPGGFSVQLTGSRTLLDLDPGSYTVTARDVRVAVGDLEAVRHPTPDCAPAVLAAEESCTRAVEAGALAEVTVAYEPVPGTGMLWIPSYFNGQVAGYVAAQLGGSSSDPPTTAIDGAASAQGLAFDAQGNLWVGDWDVNRLRMYTPDMLAASGNPTPAVVIDGNGALMNPTGLAFDAQGNLWVTNRGNATVVKYGAQQLTASGSPTPQATIMDDGSGNLNGPNGIAFDSEGSLWFSNLFSQSLYKFANPGSLSGDVTPSPDIIISTTITGDPSLQAPSGLAFDAAGNLWVSNQGLNTVVAFTPAQLGTSGTPEPEVIIAADAGSLASPGGLAFDAGGSLWVANAGSSVVRYGAAQLAASGAPAPDLVLTGLQGIDLGFLAFDPPPGNLPLAQGGRAGE